MDFRLRFIIFAVERRAEFTRINSRLYHTLPSVSIVFLYFFGIILHLSSLSVIIMANQGLEGSKMRRLIACFLCFGALLFSFGCHRGKGSEPLWELICIDVGQGILGIGNGMGKDSAGIGGIQNFTVQGIAVHFRFRGNRGGFCFRFCFRSGILPEPVLPDRQR